MKNILRNKLALAIAIRYGERSLVMNQEQTEADDQLRNLSNIANMSTEDILLFVHEIKFIKSCASKNNDYGHIEYMHDVTVLLKAVGEQLKKLYDESSESDKLNIWKRAFKFCEAHTSIDRPNIDKTKYSGFTCPVCGSHMFGSFRNLSHNGRLPYQQYPEGAIIGYCNENQYSFNGCNFIFNRDDKQQENACIYEMSLKEHIAQYKDDSR